jgi:hypothetical protein
MYINEYSQGVLPQYQKSNYDLNLEMAILSKKNQEQANALNTVNQLQNRSLNISMLNLEGAERLAEYNKQLSADLSGDLGDLTIMENQNKVAELFQKISTDTELIKASQLSKQYQKEYNDVQTLKNSGRKDNGYNDINEFVWMNWDGGYYDFMQKGLSQVTDPNFRKSSYTPYKDLKVPLANLSKLLHADYVSNDRQSVDEKNSPTGYLTKHIYEGVSPERVKALYDEQFGADDISQLEVLSKYEILKAGDKGYLYDQYKSVADAENRVETARISEISQRILFNNEKLKTVLKPEEEAQLIKENELYKNNLQILESNVAGRANAEKTKEDFLKLSNNEMLGYVYQVKKAEKVKDAVNAFSWKKEVNEINPDANYLAQKKIDAMMAQTKFREDSQTNRMYIKHKLDQEVAATKALKEKEGKEDPSLWSDVADISKNEQELLSGFNRLVTLQEEYAKKSDNIIAAPTLDNNTIKAENWRNFYEKHKGNYYADMWDIFQTNKNLAYDVNGNPNKEAFRVWEIEQRNNPNSLTEALIKNKSDNDYTSEYLTEELGKINGALRSAKTETKNILPYARTENGDQLSEADFLSGREVYINVPTSPKINGQPYTGNYQKKKLSELLFDLKKERQTESIESPAAGAMYGVTPRSKVTAKTYLDNDAGLKQVLKTYADSQEDPVLKSMLADKLPQYQQFGYVQTSSPDEIIPYQGQISAATKLGSDQFRTLFGVSAIESIAIPSGSGDKGVVKFKNEYAKQLDDANIMMPTRDGNVMEKVVPGKAYLFETQPKDGRNVMMNTAAKYKPYKSNYLGYMFEITPSASGTKVIRVTKPDGTVIPDKFGGDNSTDINVLINSIQSFIKTDYNATRKP